MTKQLIVVENYTAIKARAEMIEGKEAKLIPRCAASGPESSQNFLP